MVKKDTTENPLSDELLREVDEELKEERAKTLIKKIAPALCVVIIVALVCAAGIEFYKYRRGQQALADEARLVEALTLIDQGKKDEAAAALTQMRASAGDGYASMAAFYYVDLMLDKKEYDEALKVLGEVIADKKTPQPMRNLALFTKISVSVDMDGADFAALENDLQPLTAENSAWAPQANELGAVIALKMKNVGKAKEYLRQILASEVAGADLRSRASQNLMLIEKELQSDAQ